MGTRKIKDFVGRGANERNRVKLQSNFRLSVVCDAVWSRKHPKNAVIFREPTNPGVRFPILTKKN